VVKLIFLDILIIDPVVRIDGLEDVKVVGEEDDFAARLRVLRVSGSLLDLSSEYLRAIELD